LLEQIYGLGSDCEVFVLVDEGEADDFSFLGIIRAVQMTELGVIELA
jgi:hypothetical protein